MCSVIVCTMRACLWIPRLFSINENWSLHGNVMNLSIFYACFLTLCPFCFLSILFFFSLFIFCVHSIRLEYWTSFDEHWNEIIAPLSCSLSHSLQFILFLYAPALNFTNMLREWKTKHTSSETRLCVLT